MLRRSKFLLSMTAALLSLLMLAGTAAAQPGGPAAGGKVAAAPAKGDPIPPPLAAALKSGNQGSIDAELKKLNIAAPPGTPPRHECGDHHCSCAGAKGCSTIAPACKKDSLWCTADTCSCLKK